MGTINKKYSELARSHTDPIWLQSYGVLETGHNERTPNATISFITQNGRVFGITCKHVVDQLINIPTQFPSLALEINSQFHNLSELSNNKTISHFRIPSPDYMAKEIDIAICEISAPIWKDLSLNKGKKAVMMDYKEWEEIDWDNAEFGYVAGYPTEHKYKEHSFVLKTPMVSIVANVDRLSSRRPTTFTLHSELKEAHNYYFSGTSGGMIYLIQNDKIIPAGIVYEGFPSTEEILKSQEESAFLNEKDIMIHGLKLTPNIFEDWLRQAELL